MTNQKEMSVGKLIGMTISPSAVATGAYLCIGMYVQTIPSMALFMIVAGFTLFPFEMWAMLSANKKEFGTYGVKIAFADHAKMKWWQIFLYGFALFGLAGIASVSIAPLENRLLKEVSGALSLWLPAYFDWENIALIRQYPRGILIFSSALYLLLNVLVYPVIEELYFRGYLTSKLKRYGIWTPILVAVAFSFYHWWLPFQNVFRICIFGVAAVVTYRKKNIFISILFHCLCNLFSSVSFVVALFC